MSARTHRILVVDDEAAAAKSVEKILSKKGFEVDIALGADEGLNRIEKGLFELVLLDIMMPRVNGIEMLGMIQERWPDLNVLMVTGYPSIETAVEATRLGAVDYIAKPFTPQELREKVKQALPFRVSGRVIPMRPLKDDAATALCPLGEQLCEIFSRKGTECKTKDGICPKIKKMRLRAKRKADDPLAVQIGKAAIDIDMPFDHRDVAATAGRAYVQALDASDLPRVNWGEPYESLGKTLPEILVIDDEVVVGNSIRKILEPRGFRVAHAQNPESAMQMLSALPVDMILLDMRIPGVTGFELLDALKAEHPATPVIVITGYATVETAIASMKKGASDYVAKPFTPAELHHAVEKGLRLAA